MIPRYTRAEMGRVWSEENKFQKWLEVELAATETLAEAGVVPREAAAKLRERARVDVARINEIEAKVRHDVIAFTIAVQESVGDPEAARWLHYGLTSNDVVDTAQALLIREASKLIEKGIERFGEVLERRAWEFKDTPEIGRTHGIHAEPITFGLKIANWYAENRRDLERFRVAAQQIAVGKISGAVGTCTHLGPEIEQKICARLGLATAPITSQVIERDRHAQYLSTLAIVAASLERVAQEIRHLQRTEVREVEEPFGGEQRGSSAMPHKRNPVSSRADLRARARGAREFGGGARKCRAVARARYFAQLGGARDSARFDDPAGLHAAPHDRNRRQHESVSRAHAAKSGFDARAWFFRGSFCRTWWNTARRAKTRTSGCRVMRWRRGNRRRVSRSASRRTRIFASSSTRKRWRTRLICGGNCAPWTRFSRAFSGRKLPSRCNCAVRRPTR